jgi:hypothetical protein
MVIPPVRQSARFFGSRPGAPLLDSQEDRRSADDDLEDADEGGRTACVGVVDRIDHESDDDDHDGDAHHPAGEERNRRRLRVGSEQHQDDRDDGHRRDGHAQRDREQITDDLTHGPLLPFRQSIDRD